MAEIREILFPAPIVTGVQGLEWPFEKCVQHMLDNEEVFNSNGVGIRAACRIETALKNAAASQPSGQKLLLDEADWKLLHGCFENPKHGYMPQFSLQKEGKIIPGSEIKIPGSKFITYIDAVSDENTKPKQAAA